MCAAEGGVAVERGSEVSSPPMSRAVPGLESCTRQCRRAGFNPWVRKIPEEGNATHLSFFAWEIPWTEELGGLQSMGLKRVGQIGRAHV